MVRLFSASQICPGTWRFRTDVTKGTKATGSITNTRTNAVPAAGSALVVWRLCAGPCMLSQQVCLWSDSASSVTSRFCVCACARSHPEEVVLLWNNVQIPSNFLHRLWAAAVHGRGHIGQVQQHRCVCLLRTRVQSHVGLLVGGQDTTDVGKSHFSERPHTQLNYVSSFKVGRCNMFWLSQGKSTGFHPAQGRMFHI